jgi:2-dehydro-3-deoxyglucarate aldolase/4-hydroxy-2-oxoheptanedioate aldolase
MVRAAGVKAGKSRRGGAASGPALAFWLEYPSLPACEIAALCGYDAVIFDHEHGVMPQADADRLTLACKRLGLTVYSRVASAERVAVQHALDAGVDGVILRRSPISPTRGGDGTGEYPPLGSRGVGYSRAMGYDAVAPNFFERENGRTLCWPMIETPGALADAAAIAALDTVDGLFVGPADLSMTRGRGAFRATDKDLADLAKVAAAAKATGKSWALPAPGAKVFAFARRHGASLVTVGDDLTALRVGFTQGLAVAKG